MIENLQLVWIHFRNVFTQGFSRNVLRRHFRMRIEKVGTGSLSLGIETIVYHVAHVRLAFVFYEQIHHKYAAHDITMHFLTSANSSAATF